MTHARMTRRLRVVTALTTVALVCLTACGHHDGPSVDTSTSASPGAPNTPAPTPSSTAAGAPAQQHGTSTENVRGLGYKGKRPNIVFVLTDDLSDDLVPFMPHVQALMTQGMTFTNYTVTNSLCCPSRASIFTGEFPHNTGVESNDAPNGGWAGFTKHDDEAHTFAVALQEAGYRTGFFGKYLNGYDPSKSPKNPIGWTDWGGVNEGGYVGYDYTQSDNGRLVRHGRGESNYLTSVLSDQGRSFIRSAAAAHTPFALEVATFSPHNPYVPAPQDRHSFLGLSAPRTPAFDRTPKNAPPWLSSKKPLTAQQIAVLDLDFRLRVEDVQSIDRTIMQLQNTLRATGQLNNTIFVFSSDNGLHLGQYRMTAGKLTAFDTDIKVPLIVSGPGIRPGSVSRVPVENVDLAPTFEQLGGAPVPSNVDGHSIVALLRGAHPKWRTYALVEHGSTKPPPGDPDQQPPSSGGMGPYRAIRTTTFTYVEYASGAREYYDRVRDPYELDNLAPSLSAARIAQLHSIVAALGACRGAAQCWQAARPT